MRTWVFICLILVSMSSVSGSVLSDDIIIISSDPIFEEENFPSAHLQYDHFLFSLSFSSGIASFNRIDILSGVRLQQHLPEFSEDDDHSFSIQQESDKILLYHIIPITSFLSIINIYNFDIDLTTYEVTVLNYDEIGGQIQFIKSYQEGFLISQFREGISYLLFSNSTSGLIIDQGVRYEEFFSYSGISFLTHMESQALQFTYLEGFEIFLINNNLDPISGIVTDIKIVGNSLHISTWDQIETLYIVELNINFLSIKQIRKDTYPGVSSIDKKEINHLSVFEEATIEIVKDADIAISLYNSETVLQPIFLPSGIQPSINTVFLIDNYSLDEFSIFIVELDYKIQITRFNYQLQNDYSLIFPDSTQLWNFYFVSPLLWVFEKLVLILTIGLVIMIFVDIFTPDPIFKSLLLQIKHRFRRRGV